MNEKIPRKKISSERNQNLKRNMKRRETHVIGHNAISRRHSRECEWQMNDQKKIKRNEMKRNEISYNKI